MAVTYVDTDKLKDIAASIDKSATEYDVLINKLFKRLLETPVLTKEWSGDQSKKYFGYVALDKTEFLNFGTKIKEFSKKINDDASLLSSNISNAKKIEKKD